MEELLVTNATARTLFIEAGSQRYAYRRFGRPSEVPMVFLQHYTGNMDNWDPLVTDGLACSREIIVFDNVGVAGSSGQTPDSVEQMALDAISFINALELKKVDLLGYSLGGFIAQIIASTQPALVSKLILVGTGPKGGEGISKFREYLTKAREREGAERYLFMFFEATQTSLLAGNRVLQRLQLRKTNRDAPTTAQTFEAQTKAIESWGLETDVEFSILKKIQQPVLVINGSNDAMFPTINSYWLFQHLPNAWLSLYPDSAHGSLFQYARQFVQEVTLFLKQHSDIN